MFGNWLRRKMQLAGVKAGTEDIGRFVAMLRGQSEGELAALLVAAAMLRYDLDARGILPLQALEHPSPLEPMELDLIPLKLNRLIGDLQKHQHMIEAAGCMVWLHSMRAIVQPELRYLGREMWGELVRGVPDVENHIDALKHMAGIDVPSGVNPYFIPEALAPF